MISRPWAWVASLAVLFAGVTNAHAHVHLCFDGQEPPASVHVSDADGHHDGVRPIDHADDHEHHDNDAHHDDDADHDDVDLDLANPALAKTVKHDIAAIASLWLKGAAIVPSKARAPALDFERPAHSFRPYLHPPLRGPPL